MRAKPRLSIRNVGPLQEADIDFGDLTVFVGPQASGKSIAFQWLKLLTDTSAVKAQLADHGTDWAGDEKDFMTLYFGEGMSSLWNQAGSAVSWNGERIDLQKLIRRKASSGKESTFLIPAQRVLTLRDGWPRPFSDYGTGDPYSVRAFSEKLRLLMEDDFKVGTALFPQANRLKAEYRKALDQSIFGGFSLSMVRTNSQKRLVLKSNASDLAYMVWSAGQREFVPLLLGLYWLMPPSRVPTRKDVEWVIIEELEMGLHPEAISTVLLLILELLARGYKVCLSSHSPQVLELVWTWRVLQAAPKPDPGQLLDLLKAKKSAPLLEMAAKVISKECKVFYFERGKITLDITNLNPDSPQERESTWGGLLEFSGKANQVVAKAIANSRTENDGSRVRSSSRS